MNTSFEFPRVAAPIDTSTFRASACSCGIPRSNFLNEILFETVTNNSALNSHEKFQAALHDLAETMQSLHNSSLKQLAQGRRVASSANELLRERELSQAALGKAAECMHAWAGRLGLVQPSPEIESPVAIRFQPVEGVRNLVTGGDYSMQAALLVRSGTGAYHTLASVLVVPTRREWWISDEHGLVRSNSGIISPLDLPPADISKTLRVACVCPEQGKILQKLDRRVPALGFAGYQMFEGESLGSAASLMFHGKLDLIISSEMQSRKADLFGIHRTADLLRCLATDLDHQQLKPFTGSEELNRAGVILSRGLTDHEVAALVPHRIVR